MTDLQALPRSGCPVRGGCTHQAPALRPQMAQHLLQCVDPVLPRVLVSNRTRLLLAVVGLMIMSI